MKIKSGMVNIFYVIWCLKLYPVMPKKGLYLLKKFFMQQNKLNYNIFTDSKSALAITHKRTR